MVPFDMLIWFPISVLQDYVCMSVFEIFDFKNAVTLKTGLRVRKGH